MRAGAPGSGSATASKSEDRSDDQRARRAGHLVCARCSHRITSHADGIEVRGRFVHEATNPQGFHFRFGCFARAPGVIVYGEPSSYYTWFPGTTWRMCRCGQCEHHIGWVFEKPQELFYGLVLDRLRDEPAS